MRRRESKGEIFISGCRVENETIYGGSKTCRGQGSRLSLPEGTLRRTAGGVFENRDVLRKKSRKIQLERRRIAKMRDTKPLKTSWRRATGATNDRGLKCALVRIFNRSESFSALRAKHVRNLKKVSFFVI